MGYTRDIDLSHFATTWLEKSIKDIEHKWADGSIKVCARPPSSPLPRCRPSRQAKHTTDECSQ